MPKAARRNREVAEKILAVLTFLSTVIAIVFGARTKQKQAEAKAADQRANVAEAANATHTRVQHNLEQLEEKHNAEDRDAQASVARGDRGDFSDTW